MNLLLIFIFLLLLGYVAMLLWMAIGYIATSYYVSEEESKSIPLTIIICARDEQKNISACLSSILNQQYRQDIVQLIFINDASSDHTVQIAETILNKSALQYRIITNKHRKGKKESITYAMTLAQNDLIVLRDADTFTESNLWLQTIADFHEKTNADLVIAPVAIANHSVLLWALQAIENNILAVIACGSSFFKVPFLCNGANLVFTKQIFEKTNGYSSHLHYDSGDDIFFMEDVRKIQGSNIKYLKSRAAIVFTYPCYSITSLLQQKIRWASKFKANKNMLNLSMALLIFIVNLSWLLAFACAFTSVLYQELALKFIMLKLLIDILLLFLASGFIKNKNLLWFSLPAGCVYPLYSCIVGVASLFVKPKWK